MLTPLCLCLSVRPSVSVCFCLPLYLSLSISLYVSICLSLSVSVSICLSLYLSVSLCRCVCVCLCLCFCLSLVIWFRHEFISVCISGGPDSTDLRADFLTFYFFNEDITYVCNICGIGVTYKMVWLNIKIVYVMFHMWHITHTHVYIFSFTQHILLFLIHLC